MVYWGLGVVYILVGIVCLGHLLDSPWLIVRGTMRARRQFLSQTFGRESMQAATLDAATGSSLK